MHSGPIIASLAGSEITEEEKTILTHPNLGGIILFTKNFTSKQQICKLVNNIREIAQDKSLLIMVDHEGGRVWRFKNKEFLNPGATSELGKLYKDDPTAAIAKAKDTGYQIAKDLLECGIDLNLSPVLDIDYGKNSVIGNRAFSNDINTIIKLAGAFIAGQNEAGMRSVGKHFPGHSWCTADTHTNQAIDERPFEKIEETDLKIYSELKDKLNGVMVSHVTFPQVDKDLPASFSKKWLNEILREKIKFTGPVISDCLSMQAAKPYGGTVIATDKVLAAGCDLVIFSNLDSKNTLELLDGLQWQVTDEQCTKIKSLQGTFAQLNNTTTNSPTLYPQL